MTQSTEQPQLLFPDSVLPQGATWVSDDSSRRYGATVIDGFNLLTTSTNCLTFAGLVQPGV